MDWKDINQEKPECNKYVWICYGKNQEVDKGRLVTDKERKLLSEINNFEFPENTFDGNFFSPITDVTHWMELPDKPKSPNI